MFKFKLIKIGLQYDQNTGVKLRCHTDNLLCWGLWVRLCWTKAQLKKKFTFFMVPPRNVCVIMFEQPSNYSVHLSGSKLSNNQLSEWYLIQENPQNYSMLSFEVCFFYKWWIVGHFVLGQSQYNRFILNVQMCLAWFKSELNLCHGWRGRPCGGKVRTQVQAEVGMRSEFI